MFAQLSPNRMSVPPPYGRHASSRGHSSLVFVSKVLLSALAIALVFSLIALVPAKILIPIASVAVAGAIVSLAVVRLDRWISKRRSQRPESQKTERIELEPGEAAGLMSFALLIVAVFTPAGARALLSSAGLFGLGAFRFAAARSGWVRRGIAWT